MTDRPRRPAGDELLVRRAARRFAVVSALLVGASVLLMVALAGGLVLHQQRGAADALLRSTGAHADDVGDPPPGVYLVLERDGRVTATPGLPERLSPLLTGLRADPARPRLMSATVDERSFRVLTQPRGSGLVQVALDLRAEHEQRNRLVAAMLVTGGIGLLLAAAVGALLGRRAVRPLGEALALQRTFVADAGHELRTPLTLLSTRAQVLAQSLRRSQTDEQTVRDADGVVRDALRLGAVVEDLLLVADPRADDVFSPVDLGRLAVEVVDSAREHAAGVDVRLVAEPADGCLVLGAAAALRRAALALVDNAVEHTPPGGQVTVSVRRDRQAVLLTVSDTGSGVDPSAAPDVFRRFSSGGQRSGRRRYGLGLALSRDVADRHGGHLRLVSPGDGRGATFELSLPAA